ncbi:4Fe-4S dicluster domain-containing protein, partial [bacterium]|nr:4Fe-4S dicluster domain-containing protein [bacterium]MBU1651863.1 4Fe-4S dicluster domain-containing protein [bacterium]
MAKIIRKIIEIDELLCDGCGECIVDCPEQAIQIVDTNEGPKAQLVAEIYCDGLGACIGACPTGAMTVVERESDAFDEEATLRRINESSPEKLNGHVQHQMDASQGPPPPKFSGCPSSRVQQWSGDAAPKTETGDRNPGNSELRQWPIQLNLLPPFASFFKDAHLTIIADCVPFAYTNFHQDFVKGRAIAVGCPKLDDKQAYVEKIAQIIQIANPRSFEIVIMEVPCCSGLTGIVQQAMEKAGKQVPLTETVIKVTGQLL